MATSYKILAQACPSTTAETTLGNVPNTAGTSWVVSTLTITNITALSANATVNICQNNAASSNANTLMASITIPPDSLNTFTIGLTLGANDYVRVTSGTASALTYMLFGSEITA